MWVRFLVGRCARITWPFCCHSSLRIVVSQSLSFPPAAIVALRRLQKPIWKINKGLTPVHLVASSQMFHRSQGAVCTNHISLYSVRRFLGAFGGKKIIDSEEYNQTASYFPIPRVITGKGGVNNIKLCNRMISCNSLDDIKDPANYVLNKIFLTKSLGTKYCMSL